MNAGLTRSLNTHLEQNILRIGWSGAQRKGGWRDVIIVSIVSRRELLESIVAVSVCQLHDRAF